MLCTPSRSRYWRQSKVKSHGICQIHPIGITKWAISRRQPCPSTLPDQFSLQFKRLICFFGDDGEEFDGEDCLRWRRWGTHTRWKPSNQESYLWYPQPSTCLILRKNRAALSCCSGLLLLWWFVVMRGAFDSASVFVFLAGVISKTIVHVDFMISCD